MGMIYKNKYKDKAGAVHESEVFWIKYYRNGKAYRESSKTTKEDDAKKLLKLREGEIVRFQKVLDRSGMELRGGFASLIH